MKYGNIHTVIDNYKFDSLKESYRYKELKLMLKAGQITDLEMQPRFLLQRGFTDSKGKKHRAIEYVADFAYTSKDGREIIEDVKASLTFKTEVYKIKKKLFIFKYGDIDFREIY